MLPVVWIPEAKEDLLEAIAWYDNIHARLGERFALAVEATIEATAEHPSQFPDVHRDHRRAGVRRFPYGIFYEVQEERIVVIAFFSRQAESHTLASAAARPAHLISPCRRAHSKNRQGRATPKIQIKGCAICPNDSVDCGMTCYPPGGLYGFIQLVQ